MAGDKVIMPANAMMMIHNAWTIIAGNKNDLRKMADDMEKIDESIVTTYVTKTGKEQAEIVQMMDDETWLTAEDAVKHGFADEIEQEKKLSASVEGGFLMFNSQRFDTSKWKKAPEIAAYEPEKPNENSTVTPEAVSDSDITEQKTHFHAIKTKLLNI